MVMRPPAPDPETLLIVAAVGAVVALIGFGAAQIAGPLGEDLETPLPLEGLRRSVVRVLTSPLFESREAA